MSTGSGLAAVTGIVSPALKPSSELPGVIWRNLRPRADFGPDRDRRVDRQRFGVLVEAEREFGGDLAVFELDRDDLLDDADADAADPHLVAFDQGVGVGDPRLEVVGGDEGQAVVGVVGEEDGDDDDQHGHRPDQDRAARDAAESAAVPHGPGGSREGVRCPSVFEDWATPASPSGCGIGGCRPGRLRWQVPASAEVPPLRVRPSLAAGVWRSSAVLAAASPTSGAFGPLNRATQPECPWRQLDVFEAVGKGHSGPPEVAVLVEPVERCGRVVDQFGRGHPSRRSS